MASATDIVRLRTLLRETTSLLEGVDATGWTAILRKVEASSDEQLPYRVLGLFGGMGSLNDLTIHPLNGHTVDERQSEVYTSRLAELTRQLRIEASKAPKIR